jgi:putative ABC transport system permease protein
VGSLWYDVRFGLRMLRKNFGFTITAVLILALGIGANTAIFSLVNNVLFRPLPVERSSELVNIGRRATAKELPSVSIPWPMYLEYRDNPTSAFVGLAAYNDGSPVTISQSAGHDVSATAAVVTGNYFNLLGVRAIRGRIIGPEDDLPDSQGEVVVLSYRFWREEFGGRGDVLGTTVHIADAPYRIIGVAPDGFYGIGLDSFPDVWLPMSAAPAISSIIRTQMHGVQYSFIRAFGRLKPGVNLAQARQQLEAVAGRLDAGKSIKVEMPSVAGQPAVVDQWEKPWPSLELADETSGKRSKDQMLLMVGAVALLFLLGVSDLTSLLLARIEKRRREVAIRLALGASRWQVARAIVVESLLLSGLGAAAGLVVAYWTVNLMGAAVSAQGGISLKGALSILDGRVLVFNILIAVFAGIIIGLVTAYQAGRSDVLSVMKSDTPTSTTGKPRAALRGSLTVFQIAASVVLLSATLLLVRAYWAESHAELAFNSDHILAVWPYMQGYKTDDAEKGFLGKFLDAARAVPGVRAAAVGSPVLLGVSVGMPAGYYYKSRITPGYFRVLDMPILRGRDFTDQDRKGSPYVGIVNQKMADQFWAGKDPIGQHVKHVLAGNRTVEIVGVVPDMRKAGIGEPEDAVLYLPLDQFYSEYSFKIATWLVVRGDDHPGHLYPGLVSAASHIDKNVTLPAVYTATQWIARQSEKDRFRAQLIGVFAILALTLAAAGLYGLISYITTARTHEFGLRLALGASRFDVVRLILRGAIFKALTGVVVGFALEFAVMRFLSTFVRGVNVVDAPTFGIVAAILFCVALAAAYIPARRASRLDPMVALRHD